VTAFARQLYLAAPAWLQDVLLSAYGLRLRYLRSGPIRSRTLAGLRRSQWLGGEELRQLQLTRLTDVVAHARETVPLYRERDLPAIAFTDLSELQQIPILRKDELRAPRATLVSERYEARCLLAIHTGGTTGKPLTIHCDRATLQRNYAFFARFREWAGIPSGARVATFAGRTIVPPGQSRPPFWRRNMTANTLLFSSYHIAAATLPAYVNALARWQPALIDSYPSSLAPVARYILERGIETIRPRAVITSSETLMPEIRRDIELAFRCRVFDHYGAAEMAALVTQCEAGSYHVNPEFGVVELLRDGKPVETPGELGEIVATGFINPVMPLIRYATGDLAAWGGGASHCPCGRAFPTLERIEGRMDDVLVTPEGRLIGRLDPIFKAVGSLYETRIVQDGPDHVRVEVVVAGAFPETERQTLLHELSDRMGPSMRIDLIEVPQIPRTAAGKFQAVSRIRLS